MFLISILKKFKHIPEKYHNFYKWHIGSRHGHIKINNDSYSYDIKSNQGSGAYIKKLVNAYPFKVLEKCELLIDGMLCDFNQLLSRFEDNIGFQDDELKDCYLF